MINTAIIGLGNIGFQLGLDPLRKESWSHAEAYSRCEKTQLVAAVELDKNKTELFNKHFPDVPVYSSIPDLMQNSNVELVSICTPMESHYDILFQLVEYPGIKGIFCEKPISATVGEARRMVDICDARGILLAVNHLKSWNDSYLHVKSLISSGHIGNVKAVNAFYPSRLFNMGSHLFDSIFRIIGLVPEKASGISFDLDSDDPTVSGWISCKDNVVCTIGARGKREDFLFEIDIIGENGRIRLTEIEGAESIETFLYEKSPRYSNYRELFYKGVTRVNKRDMFVEAVNDLANAINGSRNSVNCTGKDGLRTLSLCFAMHESAKSGSVPVAI